jgi:hypothetical protein
MAQPDDKEPTPPKPNWIDNLAQRSTGLPGNDPPPKPARSGDSTLWSLAGLGFQFAASTAILAYIGVYIDRRTGHAPWGVVTLVALALIGNLYLLIKQVIKSDSPTGPEVKKDSESRGRPPKGDP